MTTKVKIENVNGPEAVTVYNDVTGRMIVLLPGEVHETYITNDHTLAVREADLVHKE